MVASFYNNVNKIRKQLVDSTSARKATALKETNKAIYLPCTDRNEIMEEVAENRKF